MRMAFGLVGLLVTLGVIVYIMKEVELPEMQQAADVNNTVGAQVHQMAGTDANGKPVGETFKLEPQMVNGRLADMQVSWIDPAGAMATHFGLQQGDLIVATVNNGVAQKISENNNDDKMSRDLILQAYQTGGQLLVLRNGSLAPITLPADANAPGAVPNVTPSNPVNDAMKGLQIPTH